MKSCSKCSKENRDNAVYCKWCGNPFADSDPYASLIAKDGVADILENFRMRCRALHSLSEKNGPGVTLGMDWLLIGDSGTGKSFLADMILDIAWKEKVIKEKKLYTYDASTISEFNENFTANMGNAGKGILHITNAQKIVPDGFSDNVCQLDRLFAEMKDGRNCPMVILSGLTTGFLSFLKSNPDIYSLFEFKVRLNPFSDSDLTELCGRQIRQRYKLTVTDDAREKLLYVFKKICRNRDATFGNGHLAQAKAEEIVVNVVSRCGSEVTRDDITGEMFIPKTEEEIFSELDGFIGLDNIKSEIRSVINNLKAEKRKAGEGAKIELKEHYVFTGNPGTGKTTVARLFADILNALEVLPSGQLIEVTRKDLVADWVGGTAKMVENAVSRAMGGVLFIDEAYSLKNGDSDSFGQEAVDTLIPLLENNKGKFVCIIAGYTREMKLFLRSNPGMESRFGKTVEFKDYTSDELKKIFLNFVSSGGYVIEEGNERHLKNLFDRMYLGRKDTFGNAREVRILYNRAVERHNKRLAEMDDEEYRACCSVLTRLDIEGDEAVQEMSPDDIMKEMDDFVGMESVKNFIRSLAVEMQFYRDRREKAGGGARMPAVNIILTGNPGTGKTSVARVFGKLFKAMGVTASDKVVEKSRKDIVGEYSNTADKNMDKAVNEAMGGVLFLDEAYSFARVDEIGRSNDSEGRLALERLMTRMENDKGKFVLVCAGYRDKMKDFMRANEGLQSRFTHNIHIDDYSAEELLEIYSRLAAKDGFTFAEGARDTALKMFDAMVTAKDAKFGNAREAVKSFDKTMRRLSARLAARGGAETAPEEYSLITQADIPYDPPAEVSEDECLAELNALVGLDSVKKEIRAMVAYVKQEKLKAETLGTEYKGFSDHYLFLGNPGTGKTTVARIMGRILYALGAVKRPDVLEVGRAELIAGWSGQTALKTRETVMQAMGGILFIDEAYTLVTGFHDEFGQECIGTLVPLLENEKGKFVCIAAGYTREMSAFLDSNSGLASRFNKKLFFEDYDGAALTEIFLMKCREDRLVVPDDVVAAVREKFDGMYRCRTENFGNAREVNNFYRKMKQNMSRRTEFEMERLQASNPSITLREAAGRVNILKVAVSDLDMD